MNEQEYLHSILKPLLSHPDDVSVERKTDERGVLLTLRVNREDMGRVIGKDGETAKAIRRLLRQFGMLNNSRLSLRIEEPSVNLE